MAHVHIIEDDKSIREELSVLLERNAYSVSASTQFDALVEEVLQASPDIVLLDLGLPLVDGHVVCRELREQSEVPIIVVTSRDSDMDELMSINLGADDFITKPYSPHILLARIASVLKRACKSEVSVRLQYQGIDFDLLKSRVTFANESVDLTKNEARILELLMQNAEAIISREHIQHELWQSDQFIDDNTLTVNVNRVRMKLERIGVVDFLHTKRGQGYYLEKQQ